MSATFDHQPHLTDGQLVLRPLVADDVDGLYRIASDPLLWAQHPSPNRYERDVFEAFFREGLASGGALVAVDPVAGLVGSSRFYGFDPGRSEIEIGCSFVARSHWGGATNGAMKRLMLGHAFRFVESVIFAIGPDNLRSRRAVEKLGGRFEGTVSRDGNARVIYRMTRG